MTNQVNKLRTKRGVKDAFSNINKSSIIKENARNGLEAFNRDAAIVGDFLLAIFATLWHFFVLMIGGGVLLILDVAFGSVVLGLIFDKPLGFLIWNLQPSTYSSMISLFTSALQIILWRFIFNSKKTLYAFILLIPALLVALADTGVDISLTGWMVFGTHPLDFFPPEIHSLTFWFIFICVLFATGFNEALVNLLIRDLMSDKEDKNVGTTKSVAATTNDTVADKTSITTGRTGGYRRSKITARNTRR